jgi:hypothetical protein
MNILKFEDIQIIDQNSHFVKNINNSVYERTLQFIIPYHLNKVIKQGKEKTIKGTAYTTKNDVLMFDELDSKIGGLGTGLLQRTSVMSAYVYKGQFKINSNDFNDDWIESLKTGTPFYRLIYTTIKDGVKMYSEKGLNKLKEEFPEYVFKLK